MDIVLIINLVIAGFAYLLTVNLIPGLKEMFLRANLFGVDMSKKDAKKM